MKWQKKKRHRGKILWGSYSHKIGNNWFANECIVATSTFIHRQILQTETNSVCISYIKKCQGSLLFIL